MDESFPNHNFCDLNKPYCNKKEAHFFIQPIPYEATTTYKHGTKEGPQAIIDASLNMELYDEELHQETFKAGIHTLPYIKPRSSNPKHIMDELTNLTLNELEKDKVLFSLGGEHSISTGLVRAFEKKYPDLSVLYLDAHADLRNTYKNNPYNHACTARRILETTPLVLTGTRSLSAEEAEFIEKTSQKILWGKDALTNFSSINSMLTDTVYISLDVDIMDPSVIAATGTPEPNGWLWQELTGFLKNIIFNKKIVGIDIVELSPLKNNPAPDFSITKLIYRVMGYISQTRNWVHQHTNNISPEARKGQKI